MARLGIERVAAGPPSGNRNWSGETSTPLDGLAALAARIDVSHRHVRRIDAKGGLLAVDADRWACRAGWPAALVWGRSWSLSAPGELDLLESGPCQCRPCQRVVSGEVCDRCGRRLPKAKTSKVAA
jgi:hypothetical protein